MLLNFFLTDLVPVVEVLFLEVNPVDNSEDVLSEYSNEKCGRL